jgi:hypothetical protein
MIEAGDVTYGGRLGSRQSSGYRGGEKGGGRREEGEERKGEVET